jgi:hypothetical protein
MTNNYKKQLINRTIRNFFIGVFLVILGFLGLAGLAYLATVSKIALAIMLGTIALTVIAYMAYEEASDYLIDRLLRKGSFD